MKKKLVIAAVACAVLLGGAGAGAWWYLRPKEPQPAKVEPDDTQYKFVRLDKVFVMLRSPEGANFATPLSVDLVFKVHPKQAKAIKEELPLLQAVAHKTLAQKTRAELTALTPEQVAELLDKAFTNAYQEERRERPFTSVMIGKLVIE